MIAAVAQMAVHFTPLLVFTLACSASLGWGLGNAIKSVLIVVAAKALGLPTPVVGDAD